MICQKNINFNLRVIYVLLTVFSASLSSQSSRNYTLQKSVLDAGGGESVSAHYTVCSSAGEFAAGGEFLSSGYSMRPGFWSGSEMLSAVKSEPAAENPLPTQFYMHQNYPNPFNPVTTIEYALPRDEHASLVIYDMTARRIKALFSGYQKAGVHQAVWDGTDHAGQQVASGVYFYRLVVQGAEYQDNWMHVRKMILVK